MSKDYLDETEFSPSDTGYSSLGNFSQSEADTTRDQYESISSSIFDLEDESPVNLYCYGLPTELPYAHKEIIYLRKKLGNYETTIVDFKRKLQILSLENECIKNRNYQLEKDNKNFKIDLKTYEVELNLKKAAITSLKEEIIQQNCKLETINHKELISNCYIGSIQKELDIQKKSNAFYLKQIVSLHDVKNSLEKKVIELENTPSTTPICTKREIIKIEYHENKPKKIDLTSIKKFKRKYLKLYKTEINNLRKYRNINVLKNYKRKIKTLQFQLSTWKNLCREQNLSLNIIRKSRNQINQQYIDAINKVKTTENTLNEFRNENKLLLLKLDASKREKIEVNETVNVLKNDFSKLVGKLSSRNISKSTQFETYISKSTQYEISNDTKSTQVAISLSNNSKETQSEILNDTKSTQAEIRLSNISKETQSEISNDAKSTQAEIRLSNISKETQFEIANDAKSTQAEIRLSNISKETQSEITNGTKSTQAEIRLSNISKETQFEIANDAKSTQAEIRLSNISKETQSEITNGTKSTQAEIRLSNISKETQSEILNGSKSTQAEIKLSNISKETQSEISNDAKSTQAEIRLSNISKETQSEITNGTKSTQAEITNSTKWTQSEIIFSNFIESENNVVKISNDNLSYFLPKLNNEQILTDEQLAMIDFFYQFIHLIIIDIEKANNFLNQLFTNEIINLEETLINWKQQKFLFENHKNICKCKNIKHRIILKRKYLTKKIMYQRIIKLLQKSNKTLKDNEQIIIHKSKSLEQELLKYERRFVEIANFIMTLKKRYEIKDSLPYWTDKSKPEILDQIIFDKFEDILLGLFQNILQKIVDLRKYIKILRIEINSIRDDKISHQQYGLHLKAALENVLVHNRTLVDRVLKDLENKNYLYLNMIEVLKLNNDEMSASVINKFINHHNSSIENLKSTIDEIKMNLETIQSKLKTKCC